MLLMAYGGPETIAEVEPFLLDVRGGRPTPPELVEEVRARYAAIGGGSPLLAVTRAQAAALEARLNAGAGGEDEAEAGAATGAVASGVAADGSPLRVEWRVFVGMRHWHPYVKQAVEEIAAVGIRHGVALCLAPQYSRMSIGAYMRSLDEALAALPGIERPRLARVESWGDHPLFLDAVAERLAAAVGALPAVRRDGLHVLFTAHSLPSRIVAAGDPYDAELRATAAAVAGRAANRLGGPLDWSFCYQSAAAGAVDWLGPGLGDEIRRLAGVGCRDVVVCTVGFVADHVEVLYDVDVEAWGVAEECGVRLVRTESLNTMPRFIEALAEVVRAADRGVNETAGAGAPVRGSARCSITLVGGSPRLPRAGCRRSTPVGLRLARYRRPRTRSPSPRLTGRRPQRGGRGKRIERRVLAGCARRDPPPPGRTTGGRAKRGHFLGVDLSSYTDACGGRAWDVGGPGAGALARERFPRRREVVEPRAGARWAGGLRGRRTIAHIRRAQRAGAPRGRPRTAGIPRPTYHFRPSLPSPSPRGLTLVPSPSNPPPTPPTAPTAIARPSPPEQRGEIRPEAGVGLGDDFGMGDGDAGAGEAGEGQAHGDAVVAVGVDAEGLGGLGGGAVGP